MARVLVHVATMPLSAGKWTATWAAPAAGEGLLRLLGPVPIGETWQFCPGEYVEYEERDLPDNKKALVIVRGASRDPEFRRRRATYAITGAVFGLFLGVFWAAKLGIVRLVGFVPSAILGAVVMGVFSVRWGDRAWYGAMATFRRYWWWLRP
jgi:hypothetical protein